MTDYTKYLPYFVRSVKHGVKTSGWVPYASRIATSIKFMDVSNEPSLKRPILAHGRSKGIRIDMAKAFNVVRGDLVQVLYGRDAGTTGIVRRVLTESNQVVVSGCNVIKSFRPTDTEKQMNPALPSVVPIEAPIHITNVVPLDPVVKKPTRIKRRYSMSGECVRISKLSGCAMPSQSSPETSWRDAAARQKRNLKTSPLRGSPISRRALNSWTDDQTHLRQLMALTSIVKK